MALGIGTALARARARPALFGLSLALSPAAGRADALRIRRERDAARGPRQARGVGRRPASRGQRVLADGATGLRPRAGRWPTTAPPSWPWASQPLCTCRRWRWRAATGCHRFGCSCPCSRRLRGSALRWPPHGAWATLPRVWRWRSGLSALLARDVGLSSNVVEQRLRAGGRGPRCAGGSASRRGPLDAGWVGVATRAHVVDVAGVTDANSRLAGRPHLQTPGRRSLDRTDVE